MYDDAYKYSLLTILEHVKVCNKRFLEIKSPNDFVTTEYGVIILDAIVTRLQAIGENLKNNFRKNSNLQDSHPEIEWEKIIRFKDFISHHYEMLDYEIVFEICDSYLQKLENIINLELKKF